MPLMPWQRHVAEVGGELLDDGTPAYREVVFTVPRQSGKTSLVLPWEVQRAVGWGGRQRIAYTAQTGQDARKKIVDDQFPLLESKARLLGIRLPFHRTPGIVGVSWMNGSRLIEVASTPDAGHGQTFDLAIKDELFADTDDRRDQALRPAMVTRHRAQVIACSTMGTDESVPWNELVARGRAAVEAGQRRGIAYFEWSAEDGVDPGDPATWWSCMPALGYTIREETIALEYEAMPENEFRRAYLNQQTKADDRVISAAVWSRVCDPAVVPGPVRALAVDCTPERSAAAIGVASVGAVALADYRPGVSWLVDVVAEKARELGVPVVLDTAGPAGSFAAELAGRGVKLIESNTRDLAVASVQFFDDVHTGAVAVRSEQALDAAVAAAVKQTAGDSWRWGRKNTQADVCPLVAITLALWGARTLVPTTPPRVILLEDYLDEEE